MRPEWLPSFAPNKTRPLTPRKKQLYESTQGRLWWPGDAVASGEAAELLAWAEAPGELCCEIGFGGGEFLAAIAKRHPQTRFIGCEPFLGGVVKLLDVIEGESYKNIRILRGDARLLFSRLPSGRFSAIYILFPDPWPKQRHHKRRLIQQPTIELLARAVRPGGTVLLATDHLDYSAWMLQYMLASNHFEWTACRASDWLTPPEGWTRTRYEMKTTEEGRHPVFYRFVRK